MIEQTGIVTRVGPGAYAQVVLDRKDACGGCQPHGGCKSCLASARLESIAANPVQAEAGDLVAVQMTSGNLFAGTAILYLIPVLGLLAGAFTGAWAGAFIGLTETAGAIAGFGGGLAVGFAAVVFLGRRPGFRQRFTPTITRVV